MDKKTRNTLIGLLIGGGLAYGAYMLYRRRQQQQPAIDTLPPATLPPTLPPVTPVISTNPFANADEIKAFQDWLDKNKSGWLNGGNLNKGAGYGNFGPKTAAAYNTYKDEYAKPVAPNQTTPAPVAALKVGDKVKATVTQFGYKTNAIVAFLDGGTNGNGQIEAGKYAGTIVGFTPNSDLVIVDNFTTPMENGGTQYTFRLDKKLLQKM